jgi:hypothetical protein
MPQPTSARFLTPRLRPAHGAQVMPQHDMITLQAFLFRIQFKDCRDTDADALAVINHARIGFVIMSFFSSAVLLEADRSTFSYCPYANMSRYLQVDVVTFTSHMIVNCIMLGCRSGRYP